jgi:hypothetical protein
MGCSVGKALVGLRMTFPLLDMPWALFQGKIRYVFHIGNTLPMRAGLCPDMLPSQGPSGHKKNHINVIPLIRLS